MLAPSLARFSAEDNMTSLFAVQSKFMKWISVTNTMSSEVILISVQIYLFFSYFLNTLLSFFSSPLISPFFCALRNIFLYSFHFFICSLFQIFMFHLSLLYFYSPFPSFILLFSFFLSSFLLTLFLFSLSYFLIFSTSVISLFSYFLLILSWNNNCFQHFMLKQTEHF